MGSAADAADIAAAARRRLSDMISAQRRRDEENAAAFDTLRSQLERESDAERRRHAEALAAERAAHDRAMAMERESSRAIAEELRLTRRRLAAALAEVEGLRAAQDSMVQNQRRLHLGFVSLLKAVEQSCGETVALDQRIDAMLLSSEVGGFLDEEPDLRTARMKEFMAHCFPSTNVQQQGA